MYKKWIHYLYNLNLLGQVYKRLIYEFYDSVDISDQIKENWKKKKKKKSIIKIKLNLLR